MTLWLSRKLVLAIHDEQLAEHGGANGIREEGLLEGALARPLSRASYGEPSLAELAALYGIALARNRPFIDGNKRTAYMALVTFFDFNGARFEPPDAEAVIAMFDLGSGASSDKDFTSWVAHHVRSGD